MLGITNRAMEMLEAYLEEKQASQSSCVRLVLSPEGGGELELDKPLATDRTYLRSGRPVTGHTFAVAGRCLFSTSRSRGLLPI
jgi:hypothetical protein